MAEGGRNDELSIFEGVEVADGSVRVVHNGELEEEVDTRWLVPWRDGEAAVTGAGSQADDLEALPRQEVTRLERKREDTCALDPFRGHGIWIISSLVHRTAVESLSAGACGES